VPCKELTLLLNVYKAKVAAYSTTVNDLSVTRGKISMQEYNRLLVVSETARTASEVARLALDRHTHSTAAERNHRDADLAPPDGGDGCWNRFNATLQA